MGKNGAQLLAECLVNRGVQYIFGIPGAKIDALFDALIDTPIEVIHCRHEQNAAFMAAIVGRVTGKPGVVLVTSGPGVANLVTGLLTATTEGDPIVAIGGSVPVSMKLKESHQSADNFEITEGVTKSSVEASLVGNIPEIIENAFRLAESPRAGAVFISVPQDVLQQEAKKLHPVSITYSCSGPAPEEGIEIAAKMIVEAKNPVLFLGLESSRDETTKEIRKLLYKTKLATVGTYQAAGVIPKDLLDCFCGRVGLFQNQPGDQILDEADLVITIGYNPVEYDPEIWNAKNNKKIIHISYGAAKIHSVYVPTIENLGDIPQTLRLLIEKLPERKELKNKQKTQEIQNTLYTKLSEGKSIKGKRVHPLRFIHELSEIVDEKSTVISDVGTHYMWLARYFLSHHPRHLLFSNGQQTLGVALPWAIACCLTRPDEKIISISGDGGFLFSAMELETAVRKKLHFVHCVWSDGFYDMVRQQQLMKYRRETAVALGPIDYVQFAESFGAKGYKVNDSEELLPILKKAFADEGPVIVEVPIDYSQNHELFEASREVGQ